MWELKFRYCLVEVGFRYIDDLNRYSMWVINISRKDNLLSCSFSIGNCTDDLIEFTWSSSVRTSSWWTQRMNESSTSLRDVDDSFILNDGFSDVHSYTISPKYSMYMLASTGDSSDPIVNPSFNRYMSDPILKYVVSTQNVNISIRLSTEIQVRSSSEGSATKEDNCPNILSDRNYQISSQKFRQKYICIYLCIYAYIYICKDCRVTGIPTEWTGLRIILKRCSL